MQTYRKDFPGSELAERALSKSYIYTVAHVSGSEYRVFFVANASAWSYFRVSASVFSV